jgi:hypothetical protein
MATVTASAQSVLDIDSASQHPKKVDKVKDTSSGAPSDAKDDSRLEIRFLSPRYRRYAEKQAGEPVLCDSEAKKRDEANAKRFGVPVDEASRTIFHPSEALLKHLGHPKNADGLSATLTAMDIKPRTYQQAKAETDAMLADIAAGKPTNYVSRFSARDLRRG